MKTHTMRFIRYYDSMYQYDGRGVVIKEDPEHVWLANIIGAMLIEKHPRYTITDLPTYIISKQTCIRRDVVINPLVVPPWMLTYPIDHVSPDEIHHIGLYFEHFLFQEGKPFGERINHVMDITELSEERVRSLNKFLLDHQIK